MPGNSMNRLNARGVHFIFFADLNETASKLACCFNSIFRIHFFAAISFFVIVIYNNKKFDMDTKMIYSMDALVANC